MSCTPAFERNLPGRSSAPRVTETLLGVVVEVQNPPAPGQVQVRIHHYDGPEGQDAALWARVAVAVAGSQRGCFAIPDKGDEVLISFVGGDTRFPVVIGSLWNGKDAATENIGSRGVDRWSFRSKDGTKVSIVEESVGSAVLRMEVPGGVSAELSQAGGGKLELKTSGSTITIAPGGVTVRAGGTATVEATTIQMRASIMNVNAPMTTFSGVVQAQTVIANAIVGTLYTPGAGNIW